MVPEAVPGSIQFGTDFRQIWGLKTMDFRRRVFHNFTCFVVFSAFPGYLLRTPFGIRFWMPKPLFWAPKIHKKSVQDGSGKDLKMHLKMEPVLYYFFAILASPTGP